jgi:hypothetical protein
MVGQMKLNPDWREFIELLNANNVQYLVVGGYAVAFHGHPRYTKDLDIWVWIDPANAERMMSVLEQFGFASLGLNVQDFLTPDQIIQLGYPPNRIDLLTTIPGVEFQDCFATKIQIVIDGVVVNFIDAENLKRNKRASGRAQDLADIENLE